MAITLRQSSPDFETRFAAFLATKRRSSPRRRRHGARHHRPRARRGDAALVDYTRKFDRADLSTLGIAVTKDDIDAAYQGGRRRDDGGAEIRARPHPLAS